MSRTDAKELLNTFGSLKKISDAPLDHLNICSGFGYQKAKRVYDAFRAPFISVASSRSAQSDTED